MSLFARNLARCGQTITLQNRNIAAPVFGNTNFNESFSNDLDVQAIVKTPKGVTYFDGVNTESNVTHELCINYLPNVTAETWVLLKGRRLDILNVVNCCEKDNTLILQCSERGTREASKI